MSEFEPEADVILAHVNKNLDDSEALLLPVALET